MGASQTRLRFFFFTVEWIPSQGLLSEGTDWFGCQGRGTFSEALGPHLIKIAFVAFHQDENLFLIENAKAKVHIHVCQPFWGVCKPSL